MQKCQTGINFETITMRNFLTSFILLLLAMHSFAQIPGNRSTTIPNASPEGVLKGKVFDTGSNQPMEYASIALFSSKDSSLITGAVSANDGSFTLSPIKYGKYYAVVNFIGFQKKTIKKYSYFLKSKSFRLGNRKTISIGSFSERSYSNFFPKSSSIQTGQEGC